MQKNLFQFQLLALFRSKLAASKIDIIASKIDVTSSKIDIAAKINTVKNSIFKIFSQIVDI